MDTSRLLSTATAALASFTDVTRLYALEGGAPLDSLQVERWCGTESLSSCYAWTIDALSTDAGLPLDAMLGQRGILRTTQADGTHTLRSGLVREAQLLGADGGLARYRLVLVPWLWLLSQGRHSRIFQDKSVLDIASAVFADYASYASFQITADARSLIGQVRPRSYAVQYRETDLAFIERLFAEEGLGYRFVEDKSTPAGHTLVIFGDTGRLPEDINSAADPSGGVRFHRAAAVEASDTVQAIGPTRTLAPDAVTLLSYNYKSLTSSAASVRVSTTRTALPTASVCRRDQRSSSGPANGPTTVNGSSSTAKAPATEPAVAIVCGEKKNSVARPTWNMPSPHWETSRTVKSLRKPSCATRERRSATTLMPAVPRPWRGRWTR